MQSILIGSEMVCVAFYLNIHVIEVFNKYNNNMTDDVIRLVDDYYFVRNV